MMLPCWKPQNGHKRRCHSKQIFATVNLPQGGLERRIKNPKKNNRKPLKDAAGSRRRHLFRNQGWVRLWITRGGSLHSKGNAARTCDGGAGHNEITGNGPYPSPKPKPRTLPRTRSHSRRHHRPGFQTCPLRLEFIVRHLVDSGQIIQGLQTRAFGHPPGYHFPLCHGPTPDQTLLARFCCWGRMQPTTGRFCAARLLSILSSSPRLLIDNLQILREAMVEGCAPVREAADHVVDRRITFRVLHIALAWRRRW